jgi:hypothetical protein
VISPLLLPKKSPHSIDTANIRNVVFVAHVR